MIPRWTPAQWLLRVVIVRDPARGGARGGFPAGGPPAGVVRRAAGGGLGAVRPVPGVAWPACWCCWCRSCGGPASPTDAPDVPGGRGPAAGLHARGAAGVVRPGRLPVDPALVAAVGAPRGAGPAAGAGVWAVASCSTASASGPGCGSPAWPRAVGGGAWWLGERPRRASGSSSRCDRLPPVDEEYVERVLSCVERIPRGRVTTYGAIGDVVGGGPRWSAGDVAVRRPGAVVARRARRRVAAAEPRRRGAAGLPRGGHAAAPLRQGRHQPGVLVTARERVRAASAASGGREDLRRRRDQPGADLAGAGDLAGHAGVDLRQDRRSGTPW